MTGQTITDEEWLMQRIPDVNAVQIEAFMERVAIMLERTDNPSWSHVEYVRQLALENLQ